MVNCHASIKGLFGGMVIFSCTLISILLYAIFQNKITDDIEVISVSLNIPQTTTTGTSNRNRSLFITSTRTSSISGTKNSKKILYSIAIIEIVNLFLIIISLCATTWALIKIRKLEYRRITTRK